MIVINISKKKRIITFLKLLIVFSVSSYIFDYVFRPSNIDLSRNISIAVGFAFGISFVDLLIFKDDKK